MKITIKPNEKKCLDIVPSDVQYGFIFKTETDLGTEILMRIGQGFISLTNPNRAVCTQEFTVLEAYDAELILTPKEGV